MTTYQLPWGPWPDGLYACGAGRFIKHHNQLYYWPNGIFYDHLKPSHYPSDHPGIIPFNYQRIADL